MRETTTDARFAAFVGLIYRQIILNRSLFILSLGSKSQTAELFVGRATLRQIPSEGNQCMRKIKKKANTLSSLKKKAWRLLSEIVRREAADSRGYVFCYTCGVRLLWQEIQASHAIGGRHNVVLFDRELLKPCCVKCNIFLRGNYPMFTSKLIREHSLDWFEKKLADSHKIVKWTTHDMQERINEYQKRLEELDRRKAA